MLDCCTNIDKLTIGCFVVILLCILAIVYIVSGQAQQLSSLEHKLDMVHKKVNGLLGIIGIVTEGAQDIIETEMAKQAHTSAPPEELVVEEVKYVDEETKPVETPAGPEISLEEVEKTFEAEEIVV